jgi:hypothetical protein
VILLEELKAHGDLFNANVLKDLLTPLNQHYEHNNCYLKEQVVTYHSQRDTSIHQGRNDDSKECDFKIVKMVHTRNHFDRAWCFGFTKRRRGRSFEWKGAFAGTYESLFQGLKNFIANSNRQTKEKTNLQLVLPQALGKMHIMAYAELKDVASEIYENLLDQREWDDFDGVTGLMGHIAGLTYVARNKYISSEHGEADICSFKNEDGNYLIFNSGLLDKYTNFVLLQCKLLEIVSTKHNEKCLNVESISLVSRLAPDLMDKAFPVLQLCSRDRFFFPSDRIFLDHTARLDHMFTERWDRLDADGHDYSPDVLFKSLQSSVDLALKMNQIDSSYIIPYYNLKQSDVLYLIPLYVGSVVLSKPVCAVSVGLTRDGVWAPITILTLSMARSNARLLNKLKNTWLLS